jgi:hypothetical protein
VTMNLVAIAGVPFEATPRLVTTRRSLGQETTEADKSLMWMSIGVFGGAVIAGYFFGKWVVP